MLVYVCDMLYICFSLYYLYLVCHRAPTHGGLGCRGRSPLRQPSAKLTLSTERGERGGEAAAPAGRELPQEARAARSRGRAKTRCRRHALKRWLGSGKVSTDGLQGAQPPASIKHKTYFVLERGERGGAAVRARRARASAGIASRAEPGKGENRFEPSVS